MPVETDGPSICLPDTMLPEPAIAQPARVVFQTRPTPISQPTASPQPATTLTGVWEFHLPAHRSSVLLVPLPAAVVATAAASNYSA